MLNPSEAPYAVPRRSAPSVWPVSGTGDPGIGSQILAMAARKRVPPTSKPVVETAVR